MGDDLLEMCRHHQMGAILVPFQEFFYRTHQEGNTLFFRGSPAEFVHQNEGGRRSSFQSLGYLQKRINLNKKRFFSIRFFT